MRTGKEKRKKRRETTDVRYERLERKEGKI